MRHIIHEILFYFFISLMLQMVKTGYRCLKDLLLQYEYNLSETISVSPI